MFELNLYLINLFHFITSLKTKFEAKQRALIEYKCQNKQINSKINQTHTK